MNENDLYVVKEYEFDNPLCNNLDSLIDSYFKDCHKNYFHIFEFECIYGIKLTNIPDNEIFILTNSGKSMNLYGSKKKIKNVRRNGFIFNQINELAIKFDSHFRCINIIYYLKLRISIMHRQFFKLLSQNTEYVEHFRNDRNNPFHFACRKQYLYNDAQY